MRINTENWNSSVYLTNAITALKSVMGVIVTQYTIVEFHSDKVWIKLGSRKTFFVNGFAFGKKQFNMVKKFKKYLSCIHNAPSYSPKQLIYLQKKKRLVSRFNTQRTWYDLQQLSGFFLRWREFVTAALLFALLYLKYIHFRL